MGPFSPPNIPGTPVQHESPGWLPEWRAPSGSDNDRSPYQARAADIRITEVDHIRIRQDEPIRVSIKYYLLERLLIRDNLLVSVLNQFCLYFDRKTINSTGENPLELEYRNLKVAISYG